ncbi:hypothetical protein CF326_g3508 [Tilletia indica]|nr:hypothetical protein CF326_g3508 [Tilletia indica]
MRFTSSFSAAFAVQFIISTLLILCIAAAPMPASVSRSSTSEFTTEQTVSANSTVIEARGPTHRGIATWYGQQSRGACGQWHVNSDMIVAISGNHFKMSMCGRTVAVTSRGKTIYAKVADECPGCPSGSLDISRGMFKKYANLDVGVLPISWRFV